PRVVMSRCITFEPVRYDGTLVPDDLVERMKPFVDFITVCPEADTGLPVPRDPVRIVRTGGADHLVQPSTGRDFTGSMEVLTRRFLDGLPAVDGFILKDRSPSCARRGAKVYAGPGADSTLGRSPGLFGREVIARYGRFPIEGEGRLRDGRIRDRFLTAIFTLARFREAKGGEEVRDLARFHADNQLLLKAAGGGYLRAMARVVADRKGEHAREIFALYEDLLLAALRHRPGRAANIRILALAMDVFGNRLREQEKESFQVALRRYREGDIPVSEPRGMVLSWVARFGDSYPENPGFCGQNLGDPGSGILDFGDQTFFCPYPEGLAIPDDGTDGRERRPR
ncbi:MAG TPA: DUF523 and DUF1722 domain-containing protein, partial [Methanomicrobiales archaeon]|nr:DUF523 and DUF1722 domain-containing protein [Methanomicrobiales archaeon]